MVCGVPWGAAVCLPAAGSFSGLFRHGMGGRGLGSPTSIPRSLWLGGRTQCSFTLCGPKAVGSLTPLTPMDTSGSPSAPANATPRAEGGVKVHMGGTQLFIFLNNPLGRLGSKQQKKLWLLLAAGDSYALQHGLYKTPPGNEAAV